VGATGNISFDANGNPVKSAVIMQLVNGQPRYLKARRPHRFIVPMNNPITNWIEQ